MDTIRRNRPTVLGAVFISIAAFAAGVQAQPFTNLFLLHHNVGEGLVMEGAMRDVIHSYNLSNGTHYTFWDHGYNAVGLRDLNGNTNGANYGVPGDNTDPDGLHYLFTSPGADAVQCRSLILTNHQVIAFKTGPDVCALPDAAALNRAKSYYREIRSFIELHPDKLFVVMTPPPLHRQATDAASAANARVLANWIKSSDYIGWRTNLVWFDLFDQLAGADNMLKYNYEREHNGRDPRPNAQGNLIAGRILANYLINAAQHYTPTTPSIQSSVGGVMGTQGTYTNKIVVTWSAAAGASSYQVWRGYDNSSSNAALYGVASLNYFEDTNVVVNAIYYYWVKVVYGVTPGIFSASGSGYSRGQPPTGTRRALLVGINTYDPRFGFDDLATCINDTIGIRDAVLLGDVSRRWSASNILLLTNSLATKSAIRGALATLAANSTVGDLVLYQQSSHGGQYTYTSNYLCAYDAEYSDAELGTDLAQFKDGVKVIVLIDASYASGVFKGAGEWRFMERAIAHYKEAKTARCAAQGMPVSKILGQDLGFMTACDYDQFSYENIQNSFYSGAIIAGCGKSTVDLNGDGEYEFWELQYYANPQTQALVPTQIPQYYNIDLLRNVPARSTVSAMGSGDWRQVPGDYNADGIDDLAVYNASNGAWYIRTPAGTTLKWADAWGGAGFVPVPGDYNGDGSAEEAVYSQSAGTWYIKTIQNGVLCWGSQWGGANLIPVSGDYNGDGSSDMAVYETATGKWFIRSLSGSLIAWDMAWGGTGLTPVSGDYNGDGRYDLAVYGEASAAWYIRTVLGLVLMWDFGFGGPNMTAVPGDYNGDGWSELAVYDRSYGYWYVVTIYGGVVIWGWNWGGSAYDPVPGDYDGDGVSDFAVYQRGLGLWFIENVYGNIIVWNVLWGG